MDSKIKQCRDNTVFNTNTMNEEYSACLPIFRQQAKAYAAFFKSERPKCDAGGIGQASLGEKEAASDPRSDAGGAGKASEWDPPAQEAADPWGPATAAAGADPAADEAGKDVRRMLEEAQRILDADAKHRQEASAEKAAQDQWVDALGALERDEEARRVAAEEARRAAELEAKREEERRAEEEKLREMRERAEREQARREAQEARRERAEHWQQFANTLMQGIELVNRQHGFSSPGGIPSIPSMGSSGSASSGDVDCAAATRRMNELYAQAEAIAANPSFGDVETLRAINREGEALVAANPGC